MEKINKIIVWFVGLILMLFGSVVMAVSSQVLEITPVESPSDNDTPSYTFDYSDFPHSPYDDGTADWAGSCSGYFSEVTGEVADGLNTFQAVAPMPDGSYNDCTLRITDESSGVQSNILSITPFYIDSTKSYENDFVINVQIDNPGDSNDDQFDIPTAGGWI